MAGKTITTIEAEKQGIIVLLNDKPLKQFISACEGLDGWVKVIDVNKFKKINEEEWIEIPTKTINGLVKFQRR